MIRHRVGWVTMLVIAACVSCSASGSTATTRVDHRLMFGTPPDALVVVPSAQTPAVSEAEARRLVSSPDMAIAAQTKLILFGYGNVSVTGDVFMQGTASANTGKADPRPFKAKLAWVAVYETTGPVEVHCPAMPADTPPGSVVVPAVSSPRLHSAVIIDGSTGAETTWSEPLSTAPCPHLAPA